MKKHENPFQLEKYVKYLAWKAYRNSSDQSKDADDFYQDAMLATLKAKQRFTDDGRATLRTYTVKAIQNAFIKGWQKEQRKRTGELKDADCIQLPEDLFHVRISEVFSSTGNIHAKMLLNAFTLLKDNLERYSLAELRRLSGMNRKNFALALEELSKF